MSQVIRVGLGVGWGLVWWLLGGVVFAQSWPTFRHDTGRSGRISVPMDAEKLELQWRWQSPQLPEPAWDGPARWDAYNKIFDLPAMRQYDACFHPVSDGKTVYFGSSTTDTMYAFDLQTGALRWRFVAGAPIRLAPTLSLSDTNLDENSTENLNSDSGTAEATHLYFGCDDGFAYCLDARTGKLKWRFSPVQHAGIENRWILHNHRLISTHPIRTGITIRDQVAYFAASFLPWQPTLLCAVDAETGELLNAARHYVTEHENATLEGPMLIANQNLIVPQGRVAPLLFARNTGEKERELVGGGGVTMVLTDEGDLARTEGGKASRPGQVGVFRGNERVATFPRGRAMVVDAQRFYVIDGEKLFAADRHTSELLWQLALEQPVEIISDGVHLFVGCHNAAVAIRADDGAVVWGQAIHGRGHGLALAGGCLIVSTDLGEVSVFGVKDVKDSDASPGPPVSPAAIVRSKPASETPPGSQPLQRPPFLSSGPMIRYLEPGVAELTYETRESIPSFVRVETDLGWLDFSSATSTRTHHVRLSNLPPRSILHYEIATVPFGDSPTAVDPPNVEGAKAPASLREPESEIARYEMDTHFNWTLPARKISAWGQQLIDAAPDVQGLALVIGSEQSQLAERLALESTYHVVLLVDNEVEAERLRQAWLAESQLTYGASLSICTAPLANLPGAFATVVVAPEDSVQLRRMVRPAGGILSDGQRVLWRRSPLPGAGEWSHTYGTADNSAFGGEDLGQASTGRDLLAQWVGRPGPRYQTDRQNRKPAPLSVNGRLYLQGQQRILCLDAYNGIVLWSLETPTVMRWNIPHDCANWCADADGVFVVADNQLWCLDGRTGVRKRHLGLPESLVSTRQDTSDAVWGYVATVKDQLLGTITSRRAMDTVWWGPEKWFDSTKGADTHIVAGQSLFSLSKASGDLQWQYEGLILHPTITVFEQRVYFVESVSEQHMASASQPLAIDGSSDLRLVCLELESGQQLWSRPLDRFPVHASCLYVAAGGLPDQSRVIVSASFAEEVKQFGVWAFDPLTGQVAWQKLVPWETDHHGKHIMRPALQGELLYLRPEVIDNRTGETIHRGFPSGHGCASYALTSQGFFSRLGETTWWDVRKNQVHRFERLRTDCWISTIPAQGMMLMAEGGGGCSCGSWLEASLGFLPRQFDRWEPGDSDGK